MSEDPDQDYFSDGITEDIITSLAAWQTLRVIARTSSFHYRGTDATLDEISEDLGVSYIIEGSVRKAGQRIRVTAQLIETKTMHHVWAEKYDADLADIFAVQDKITQSIVVAIYPAILLTETRLGPGDRVQNLDAWDYLLLGRSETDKFRREGNWRAIEHFHAALAIDPNYSAAHSGLAFAHFMDAWINVAESKSQAAELAYAEARRAIELDELDAMGHAVLAYAHLPFGRLDAMAASATRAIELNPSLPYGHHALGVALTYLGDHADGLRLVDEAIALAPHDPGMIFFLGGKAMAHLLLHDYESAVVAARRAIRIRYGYLLARLLLVSALGHTENTDEARAELDTLMEISPDFSTDLLDSYPLRDVDRALIDDGVRRAGP
jgi:TolB-like protein/Flp pilus assembly protein TadD